MRLKPCVAKVDGAVRSALYDLNGCRLIPIPHEVARLINLDGSCQLQEPNTSVVGINEQEVDDYIDFLSDDGWVIANSNENIVRSSTVSPSEHQLNQLLTLSIDAQQADNCLDWIDLMRVARRQGAKQLSVILSDSQNLELAECFLNWATEACFHQISLVLCTQAVVEPVIARRSHMPERLTIRAADDVPALLGLEDLPGFKHETALPRRVQSTNDLICDPTLFRRLRYQSIHGNHLHIGPGKRVFPHRKELVCNLGELVTPDDLSSIVESQLTKLVWRLTNDNIDRCKVCEFRFACTHSFTDRQDVDNLLSAPLSCHYDPKTMEWKDEPV